MTTVRNFSFFGTITDRDHFDLLPNVIRTTVNIYPEPTDYLIDAATTGKKISIMGGSRQRLNTLAEACEEAGLSYHITEVDGSNLPLRRECWQPGTNKPFNVELTPEGEPAFTVDQMRDAIQMTGASRMIDTLQRWAHADRPTNLQISPDLLEELQQQHSPKI
jgi:hypothetical protein